MSSHRAFLADEDQNKAIIIYSYLILHLKVPLNLLLSLTGTHRLSYISFILDFLE